MKLKSRLQLPTGLGIISLLVGALLYFGNMNSLADETPPPSATGKSLSVNEEKNQVEKALLRHVVLFQFKETSSSQEVIKVVDAFQKLPKSIAEIAGFEHGINNSPEGLNEGLTHCFLITFRSEKDRDVYLNHPAHQAFVELVKKHLQKAVVVDYWTGK